MKVTAGLQSAHDEHLLPLTWSGRSDGIAPLSDFRSAGKKHEKKDAGAASGTDQPPTRYSARLQEPGDERKVRQKRVRSERPTTGIHSSRR